MGQAKAETRCISRLKAGLSLQLQGRLFLNWGSALGTGKGYGLLPGWTFTLHWAPAPSNWEEE